MTFLPSVIRAEYRGGFRIHLTFNDNSENTIDFRQWLDGPVFEPLKAPEYFRRTAFSSAGFALPQASCLSPVAALPWLR